MPVNPEMATSLWTEKVVSLSGSPKSPGEAPALVVSPEKGAARTPSPPIVEHETELSQLPPRTLSQPQRKRVQVLF